MATSQSMIDYLLDQLRSARNVRARKMFGEYALYCDDKVVALVCDDQLFVKITPVGKDHVGDRYREGRAYKGAKPSMLITADLFDDGDWLSDLVRVTADALPTPGAKKVRTRSHARRAKASRPLTPEWVEVDLMPPCGHGAELHHDALRRTRVNPVAFVQGFDWLHGKTKTVTVQILSPRSETLKAATRRAASIVEETRTAVEVFLRNPKPKLIGQITKNVRVICNA